MISVVIPLYNEADNVEYLYDELTRVISSLSEPCEIIFVDDGSTDDTLNRLLLLAPPNGHRLKIISFVSHYGKSAALYAGFTIVFGELIVTMDGDGQDDPNDIPKMLNALNNYIDVVTGWRHQRHDRFLLKQLPSKIYNFLTRFVFKVPFHDNNCPFRIYRKDILNDIFLFKDYHRFILPILYNKGCQIREIPVNHRNRFRGKSKYRFTRIFTGLLDLFRIKMAIELNNLSRFVQLLYCIIIVLVNLTFLSLSVISIINKNNLFAYVSIILSLFGLTIGLLFASANSLISKINKKAVNRNLKLKFYYTVDFT